MSARRFTDEQEAEIARRYEAGESSVQLAEAYDASNSCIGRLLKRHGIEARSHGVAILVSKNNDPDLSAAILGISKDRLIELYCSQRLSQHAVSQILGVSPGTVKRMLNTFCIPRRSSGEQQKGKVQPLRPPATDAQRAASRRNILAHLQTRTGKPLSLATRSKISKSRTKRVEAHCYWCGAVMLRKPSRAANATYQACSRVCVGMSWIFRRRNGNAPRPLIVEKLTALAAAKYGMLRERNSTGLRSPNTWEQIESAGKELGARKPEIDAVLDAQAFEEPQAVKTARPEFAGVGVLPEDRRRP